MTLTLTQVLNSERASSLQDLPVIRGLTSQLLNLLWNCMVLVALVVLATLLLPALAPAGVILLLAVSNPAGIAVVAITLIIIMCFGVLGELYTDVFNGRLPVNLYSLPLLPFPP